MATKDLINSNMNKFLSIKREQEDKQLTHKCPNCPMRYPNSSLLVQHMREGHTNFVDVTRSKIARVGDKLPPLSDDKYSIATCPYCKLELQTRKKLMMHLASAHKDDEEQHDEEPEQQRPTPNVKVIRLDGSFVTPGASESNVADIQHILKAIGSTSNGRPNAKLDNKSTAKAQYKCFWCDSSFRKRGKLMDHIDTLHKDNKHRESMSIDETKPLRPLTNHRVSIPQMELSAYLPSQLGVGNMAKRSAPPADRVSSASTGNCSFTLAGSLTKKCKPPVEDSPSPIVCTFYMGKKDNPLTDKKLTHADHTNGQGNQRFSLPNNFGYSHLPFNITAAMQQSYLMSMGHATPFYAPPMPMIMPGSDFMLNHSRPSIDAQHSNMLLARRNAMAQMNNTPAPSRSKTSSEFPLDLTKSQL